MSSEHSVKPEPEEGSMVPEDTLASERDRSEISSNADIQEEPNKVDRGCKKSFSFDE